MIRKVAVGVESMFGHELDDLQCAFRAIDVRNIDIGFEWIRGPSGMSKQSIHKYRNYGRILNHGGHGLRSSRAFTCRDIGSFGSSAREFTASAMR